MTTTGSPSLAVLLVLAVGCSGAPPPPAPVPLQVTPPVAREETGRPPPRVAPTESAVRYLPGHAFRPIGNGRLGAVAGDRRVVIDQDRTTVVDPAPIPDLGVGHPIPETLGGGFLFVGERSVRYAASFDAPLAAIEVGPDQAFPELSVGVGYQRVLVRFREQAPKLYQLPGGQPLVIDPPGMVSLFGAPEGHAAALGSRGELYFSPAGTAPWRRVKAPPIAGLSYDGVALVANTASSELRLDEQGRLSPRQQQPGMVVSSNLDAFDKTLFRDAPPPPEGPELLLDPMTRAMSPEVAVAIRATDLCFLDARTGATRQTVPGAFAGLVDCFLVRGGMPSFVSCHRTVGELHLFRVDRPGAAPVEERVLRGVYASSFGSPGPEDPLTLPGRCDGSAAARVLCLRTPAGEWRELFLPAGPAGTQYITTVASPHGRALGLGFDGPALVLLVAGTDHVLRLDLPDFARRGLRYDQVSVDDDGALRLSISRSKVGGGSAGIVRVSTAGGAAVVTATALAGQLYGYGRRGLQVLPDGTMRETLDGGDSFHDVDPPPGGMGAWGRCSETGCDLGTWYRVGWGR